MAIIVCTYCGTEITAQSVEAEDGHCPECGAIITLGRSKFGDEEDELIDEIDEDFEDNEMNEENDNFLDEDEEDEEN